MLSGSRRCLRPTTVKPLRSLTEVPRTELLLFLYPHCFRDAASKPQQFQEASHGASARQWTDLSRPNPNFELQSERAPTVRIAEPVHDGQRNISPRSEAHKQSHESLKSHIVRPGDRLEDRNGEVAAPRRHVQQSKRQALIVILPRHADILSVESETRLDVGKDEQPPATLSIRKVALTRTRESHDRAFAMQIAAAKDIKGKALGDLHDPKHLRWAVPLRLLARMPMVLPESVGSDRGEKLDIPISTLYELTGSVDQNAWIDPIREGCKIKVLGRSNVNEANATLSLQGSGRARELAKQYLQAVSNTEPSEALPTGLGDRLQEPLRPVLSGRKPHFGEKYTCRADAIERPRAWTVRSFAEYVETITSMHIPALIGRKLYAGTPSHNETVAKALVEVFSDPTADGALSTRALNQALKFTCKHFEISSTTDLLFRRARSIGLDLGAETFNLMLGQALEQNNIHRFRYLLFEMQQLGVNADGMTWVALLSATKLRDARSVIIGHMKSRSLMSLSVQRAVVSNLIKTEFARLVKAGGGLQKFQDLMTAYGVSEWMDGNSFPQMLSICADEGLWNTIPQLVELSDQQVIRTKPAVLTHLHRSFRRRGSTKDSITLLSSHFAKTVGSDDAYVIPIVFLTAWNGRFYNVCRVLWHYAATHGIIPFRMKAIVALSIMKNKDRVRSAGPALWWTTAGKVIFGLDRQPSFEAEEGDDGLGAEGAMDMLIHWTPDGDARQEQLTIAYDALGRDLDAWRRYIPMRSQQMVDLLREAYERDCTWMKENVAGEKGLSWMLEHAIDVPLRRRGRSGAS